LVAPGEHLCDKAVLYCEVARVRHDAPPAEDPRFEPGSATLLIPEPWNESDPSAVGVWDLAGAIQVGQLPLSSCAEVASRLDRGEHLVGYVVGEVRLESRRGPRSALQLLVAPAGALTLSILGEQTGNARVTAPVESGDSH
jgi:hypothetical protein